MDYSAVKGVTVPAFLWRVHVQSGFKEGNRRMQCDHKPGIRPQRVDFCRHLGNPCGAFLKPVSRPPDKALKDTGIASASADRR
jgi:hypothetical protein